jgi:4-hydroxybenzoyl-CoA thioesterase
MKLELPEQFGFRTEIEVLEKHLHLGLHLGSATLFTLLNDARIAFFVALGWSEVDVEGAGTIMSDAVVLYKAESFQGDTLRIEMTAGEFSRTGCDLFYRVTNARTGAEVARAKTAIGFMDYATRKVVAVPAGFRKRFEA